MARPIIEVDTGRMIGLHKLGYSDIEIAKRLGVSRNTVIRRRNSIGLKPNRRIGEKGPSVRDNESYWLAVRRALKYVGKYIIEAAREYYEKTQDWDTFFIAMVMEPRPLFHCAPGYYAGDPTKMNFKNTKYIMNFEEKYDVAAMSGVPGPAILTLARNYKGMSDADCRKLAYKAVEESGFINSDATVKEVETDKVKICPVTQHIQWWKEQTQKALEWTPIKKWEPQKTAKEIFRNIARQTREIAKSAAECFSGFVTGNGKKGRGGGLQNTITAMAFQGAHGY